MRLKIINETPKKYCTIFFYHCLEKIIVKFYKNKHAQQQKISDNFLKALTWLLRKICLFRRLKSSFILWSECHIKQKTKQNKTDSSDYLVNIHELIFYEWCALLMMMMHVWSDDVTLAWGEELYQLVSHIHLSAERLIALLILYFTPDSSFRSKHSARSDPGTSICHRCQAVRTSKIPTVIDFNA